MPLFKFSAGSRLPQDPKFFGTTPVNDQSNSTLGQTFILEPILTQSGLIDSLADDAPNLEAVDFSMVDTDVFALERESPDIVPAVPEIVEAELDGDEAFEEMPFIQPEIQPTRIAVPFESGLFVVGNTGEVTIDYLYDGGQYQGELAIFSLEGMADLEPGSEAFIQEAAKRALSDSELGHVVISDQTEGARFSGLLGEGRDWNQGNYDGAQTVQMNAGDRFGLMLVPNGRVEQVADNPAIGGARTPLFSLATANPNDGLNLGQIVDVTGDGNTFVFEDQRLDRGSDQDYNDLIFQIRGAVGEAALMDDLIDPADDWRGNDPLGVAIVEYTKPYITPELPDPMIDIGEDIPPVEEPTGAVDEVTTTGQPIASDVSEPEIEITATPLDSEVDEVDPDFELDEVPEPLFEPYDLNDLLPADVDDLVGENPKQPLIGVIDTGFIGTNPDIDYSRIIAGSDRVDGDLNPFLTEGEDNEHGTHILGIIAAEQDNGVGIDGVNDKAPVWVGRGVGSGNWTESLIEFVDTFKASDQPNAVVNLSMDLTKIDAQGNVTTRYELTPAERVAIEYARQEGVVIVVAAGNDGGVMSALGQAAQEFDNIITVGAAERVTTDFAEAAAYGRAEYSSYGQGLDILAPGGTVDNPVLSTVGDTVGGLAGTSVATAKVTGSISQVWAANPGLNYQQIIDLVKSTATDLGTPNWDSATGTGLINLTAAISMARATTPENLTDIPATLIPSTWGGEGIVTPTERAAATPFMGKYYEWDRYTIRSGENLSAIAQRTMGNATYWQFIYNQNRGTIGANPNLIYPGQVISVPREVAAPAPVLPNNPAAGVPGQSWQYTVRPGDTLWEIARRELGNGNRWREIMKTPTGGTFTEAEARRIQPKEYVYLPVKYQSGPGTPVITIPTPTIDANVVIASVPSSIRSYAQQSIPLILEAAKNAGVTDLGQIAYILATSEHESLAGKFMEEIASGAAYEGRIDLGNTQPGDGVKYKGRGYVQITGRNNYANWAQKLGIDLVNNPALASVPAIAARILVQGMRDGSFTGVGLSRYINGANRDFYNARRIVNGIDRASDIAGIAQRYYDTLVNAINSNSGAVGVVKIGGRPLDPVSVLLKPTTQTLNFGRGQEWVTASGFKFIFQQDGNLVLYNPQGKPVWATGTNGTTTDRLSIQTDGNVVLYDRGQAVWATNTSGKSGAYFAIQGDGNLVVYSSANQALYASGTNKNKMGTLSASAAWIRDRNLSRFPGLQFTTVVSNATNRALDAGGGGYSVYPHPSPNASNPYHQWGFAKVGNHYMIINKQTGRVLDGGKNDGTLPYTHPYPDTNNPYQLWTLTQVGGTYLIVNKATGRALDSGGAGGGQIYMYPNPISGNPFHQWKLNLPGNPPPGTSGWQNPLEPGTYTIFAGSRYQTPQRPTHNGIDLSTWHSNPYVPVKAAKAGEIIEVGYHSKGWGNFIRIQHADGLRTVYAHLSKTDVKKGDRVSSGQKIGNVGSTGNSSGPHLHFEVHVAPYRHPEDTRNPENYIKF